MNLATHGYFLEETCQPNVSTRSLSSDVGFVRENQLFMSGLIFAGANPHGIGSECAGRMADYPFTWGKLVVINCLELCPALS